MTVLSFYYMAVLLPAQIDYILIGHPMVTPSNRYPNAKPGKDIQVRP